MRALHQVIFALSCLFLLMLLPLAACGMVASNVPGITLFGSQDQNFYISFGPSFQLERGDMTYSIHGAQDGGWKSELEWELENLLYVGGVASARFRENYEFNFGLWKAVTDGDGSMMDDDWFYGLYGDAPAVYSTSDLETDGLHFNMNFRYNVTLREGMTLGAILGYSYTKWEWDTLEGYQGAINSFSFYTGPLAAGGVTYKEELYVPYVGVAFSGLTSWPSLGFNLYALYSPIAQCDDEDDHVLRSKLTSGDTDGTFLSFGGDVRWKFKPQWSLTTNLNYTSYDLSGEQQQYFYGGTNPAPGTLYTGIDLEIEGSQTYVGMMLSYEF